MAMSKAHIAATNRYNAKTYDRILLKIRKDAEINSEFLREHVAARGESLNGFLLRAVKETIERDNASE